MRRSDEKTLQALFPLDQVWANFSLKHQLICSNYYSDEFYQGFYVNNIPDNNFKTFR